MKNLSMLMLCAAVLVTGCATKNYVRQTVTPVQTKVDQVADQENKTNTDLAQTKQDVSKNTSAISATDEKATGADRRAGEAMAKATEADNKADQDNKEISSLRQTVMNLDDYKVVNQGSILFGFNKSTLSKDDKAQLDMLVGNISGLKRYFIAVEGYTDKTGDAAYNLALSRRRADAVVVYLAGEKDVDFNHIHTIGLGELKPADDGKGKDARAKNRRVEVKIYSADGAFSAQGN
jgi:outer membrane protein OmpA-like peptidoglycan-associated protein